jgi:hypothetical protein
LADTDAREKKWTGVQVSVLVLGGGVPMKAAPTGEFHPAELANGAFDAGAATLTLKGYGILNAVLQPPGLLSAWGMGHQPMLQCLLTG